jgi:hypothetical protein
VPFQGALNHPDVHGDARHDICRGIHVKRDSLVSVMYAEELNAITSSVTLQRTDRHGILGQKPSDVQESL